MRIRVLVVLALPTAGLVVIAGGPAEAGTHLNVITATGVSLDGEDSDCGVGSDLFIEGSATGGDPAGAALETGTGSTLTDPDTGSFTQDSIGYPAGNFAFDYGINNEAVPEGTVIGLYASVGDPDEDPATFGEWFVLYRCADDGVSSELLYSCFGPLGTCPTTAAEAQVAQFEVEISDAAPLPGGTITAVGSECYGTTGSLQLVDGTTVLDESLGIPVDADGVIVADLTVPSTVAGGTELEVLGNCFLDDTLIGDDGVALTVQAPPTTTTTSTTAAPAAPVARPVALTPAFTG
jgi:hypothetical protein